MALGPRRAADDSAADSTAATAGNSAWESGHAAVHPLLLQAFAALDLAAGRWALLRGAEDLAGPGEDVDLLADVPDLAALDAALASVGWVRLVSPGWGRHRFWFRYDESGDRWLKLDLVDGVELGRWHQHRVEVAGHVLARGRRAGAVSRLHLADERWLRALHEVYDKGRAVPTGLPLDGPVPAALDAYAGPGAAALLASGTAPVLRCGLRSTLVAGVRRLLRATRPRRRLQAGRVLQLLGPDGAGKSTLAAALVACLPVDTSTVYMGLWRESTLERVLRRVPGMRTLIRVGRAARMCGRARMQAARGRVVVLDRSPADGLLADADRSWGGRLLLRCALRWAPEPFLVVVLDAPGRLLWERKHEHSPELLEARRQDYLAQRGDGVVLDVSTSVDQVRRAAVAAVWERLARSCG